MPLTEDATCARQARAYVADALNALAVPHDRIDDAKVMVSELAANLVQHAAGFQPYELWMYRIWGAGMVISVFDASVVLPVQKPQEADGLRCNGRGLAMVRTLSGGRCGARVTRSRQPFSMPGKSMWFGLPLSGPEIPDGQAIEAADAAETLRSCLQGRAIFPIYMSERDGISVVSLPYGLTVWIRDGQFRWLRLDGFGYDERPLIDLAAMVEDLVHRYERLRRAAMIGTGVIR